MLLIYYQTRPEARHEAPSGDQSKRGTSRLGNEMLAALIGLLALVGVITWNQADKPHIGAEAGSNAQVAQERSGR
jgi:hypothetical protein